MTPLCKKKCRDILSSLQIIFYSIIEAGRKTTKAIQLMNLLKHSQVQFKELTAPLDLESLYTSFSHKQY